MGGRGGGGGADLLISMTTVLRAGAKVDHADTLDNGMTSGSNRVWRSPPNPTKSACYKGNVQTFSKHKLFDVRAPADRFVLRSTLWLCQVPSVKCEVRAFTL